MKSTIIGLALGVCILVLAATSASALPPDECCSVCAFESPNHWCSDWPHGATRCGQYCDANPGHCGSYLTETPFSEVMSWGTVDGLETIAPLGTQEALPPEGEPEVSS